MYEHNTPAAEASRQKLTAECDSRTKVFIRMAEFLPPGVGRHQHNSVNVLL
jgi:hypothetical protein